MNIIVIGATAAISQASCVKLAKRQVGARFYLLGRSQEKLAGLRAQLEAIQGGCVAGAESIDLRALTEIPPALALAKETLGGVDVALVGHGTLIRQVDIVADVKKLEQIVAENFTSEVVCLNALLPLMNKGGVIGVVTSVAGDAARPKSATYSATKAALSRYLQGLRGTADERGVRIVDIRPGWVNTPLTATSKGKFMEVEPEVVGQDIAKALLKRWPRVLYTPWYWRWIMLGPKVLGPKGYERLR